MTGGSGRSVWRGLSGLVGLLLVVIGVPFCLLAFGQALPARVPSWHQLVSGVQRPITDSTLIRSLAIGCWLVWLAFAIAVAVEVVAAVRSPRWRHLPMPAPGRLQIPGLQRLARTLVVSAALLLPQRGLPGLAVASGAPAAGPPAVMQPGPAVGAADRPLIKTVPSDEPAETGDANLVVPAAVAAPPSPGPPRPTAEPAASELSRPGGRLSYVVRRYDSPWSIAERQLGDGTRWRDILDAEGRRLDHGRPTSGPRLHAATAKIIHPGDVLLLPTTGPRRGLHTGRVPPHPSPSPGIAGVRPVGDHHLGPDHATAAAAPPQAPTAQAPTAQAPAGGLVAAATGWPVPPTTPAIAEPGGSSLSPPTVIEVSSHQRSAVGAGVLLDAGLVGAALLGLIGVARQRQAQGRPFGRRIRLPDPELARCEMALRAGQTPDRARLVSRATEALADALVRSGATPPIVLGAVVDDDGLEILLERPAPAPPPWTSSAEGFRWSLAARDLPSGRPDCSALLPALTAVGRAAAGPADVLINLEAAGLVGIAGPPAQAAGLLHAMAAQLAGAPWASAVDLVLVGLAPALAVADRVRVAPSLAAIRDELRATADVMSATMAGHGCGDPFAGRVAGLAGDGWPPVVVFCGHRPDASELAWLSGVARPGSGVAAVVSGGRDRARWVIDVGVRPVPVDPLRLALEPTVLADHDMDDIDALLGVAEDDSGAELTDPPYHRVELSVELAADPTTERAPAPTEPAAVDGGAEGAAEPAGGGPGLIGADPDLSPAGPDQPGRDGQPTLVERLARVNPLPSPHRRADPVPEQPEADIVVRVLGTVEVDGAREFKRAKARELVVYLAMHPNGVGEAELDEALWPSAAGRVVSASTRDSTVSVARSAIGGPARLLPAQGQGREKRYQLGPGVESDWSRFCLVHRWGREHLSSPALRQALETVRGRPFEGVVSGRTYGWIHLEGQVRHIEAEVSDAADLAAGLFLDDDDPAGARWAARRGLLADPYTERLWVRLMEAAHRQGESQQVERIMDEMDVVLELNGDFSGLHPNTLAAYERLSRRHRFPAGI